MGSENNVMVRNLDQTIGVLQEQALNELFYRIVRIVDNLLWLWHDIQAFLDNFRTVFFESRRCYERRLRTARFLTSMIIMFVVGYHDSMLSGVPFAKTPQIVFDGFFRTCSAKISDKRTSK